jgi:hypothetical protein
MSNCMIIPTYWSTPDIPSWKIFDHPIPLEEIGTLGRTLDNLEEIDYPDPVILFPAPMEKKIYDKVCGITAKRDLNLHVFSAADLLEIQNFLVQVGFPHDLIPEIDLRSYGGVRNMGLLYAAQNGFDTVVMIDDDECIEKDYPQIANRYMGEIFNGQRVLGKTGCVLDADGKKYYDGQKHPGLEAWPKDALFNENVQTELNAEGPLTSCTVAFGGNMVIHRDMFLNVPFDPYGTRGEDDDYVLNARYCGLPFFFDKELLLLHLPPKRHGSYWTRQRQDILRFKYVREKIRLFDFPPETLGSFLEYFTQEDLELKVVSSSIYAAKAFVDSDKIEFNEFLNNAIMAETATVPTAKKKAENFLRFLDVWQKAMKNF